MYVIYPYMYMQSTWHIPSDLWFYMAYRSLNSPEPICHPSARKVQEKRQVQHHLCCKPLLFRWEEKDMMAISDTDLLEVPSGDLLHSY